MEVALSPTSLNAQPNLVLRVPTLNDRLKDFEVLYRIYSECQRWNGLVLFDFTGCEFIRPNAATFLCGLIFWREATRKQSLIQWATIKRKVMTTLLENGFRSLFESPQKVMLGRRVLDGTVRNAIPIRHFSAASPEDEVVEYLVRDWLGRGWVNLSKDLAGEIIGNVWEILANSFEHSESPVGLFICGQHYPTRHELALSVADFGVGIPGKVRRYLNEPRKSAQDAFRWALTRGNTTRQGRPGGLGLDMLKEFISVNDGEMAVYSRDGYFRWFGENDEYGEMPSDFRGTMINLTLKCDNRYYDLAK